MFAHPYIRDAYLEGTFVALACGLLGWFLVVRGQVFAADAMSHVAFTGAVAGTLIGLGGAAGVTVAALVLAGVLVLAGDGGRVDDTTVGTVFSWILGLGVLCLALAATDTSAGGNPVTAAGALFGSVFSLTHGAALGGGAISLACSVVVLAVARPLLSASLDPLVAAAQRIPVRALGALLLVLLAVVSAQTVRATGALLLLGLLSAPAGAALRLAAAPLASLALSAAIAVGCMWAGLAVAYAVPTVPPSSAVMVIAAGIYVAAAVARR